MKSLRSMRPNYRGKIIGLFVGFLITSFSMLLAEVSVPAIFSDHAVLQAMEKTPVWGWASSGEVVKVSWGAVQAEGKADANGKWRVHLNLKSADTSPQDLVIQGTNKIIAKDVVVGEVWFCSGQSNMELKLSYVNDSKTEIANSKNTMIRQFIVHQNASSQPQEKGIGTWSVSNPTTSPNFTAVGYYFAKKINQEINRPVGIINSSWGGTSIDSWTSEEGFQKNSAWNEGKKKTLQKVSQLEERRKEYFRQLDEWTQKKGREDKRSGDVNSFAAVELADLSSWTKVRIPGNISGAGIPSQGVVWVRHQFDLPTDYEGREERLVYGKIDNLEEVYFNGEKIFETKQQNYLGNNMPRFGLIPPRLLKGGKNVIAIRIYAPINKPVINKAWVPVGFEKLKIEGDWLAKAEAIFPEVDLKDPHLPKVFGSLPYGSHTPTYLYNGMVHPWASYGIKGVIWYQGEQNTTQAALYREVLPCLIQDWREKWRQGDFYFNICQLANFSEKRESPMESQWAELRDAQMQALSVKNTGVANLIDIGEYDIHPKNKRDVGDRLALIALAKSYGQKVAYSGPLYDSMKIEGASIRIQFKYTDGGLVAKPLPEFFNVKTDKGNMAHIKKLIEGSPLQGFAICGENKKWVWAHAVIEGETVIVSSPQVPQPVAVRYAWANNPICNLYNGANLPAFPFRTD